jgi:hypothetical protein
VRLRPQAQPSHTIDVADGRAATVCGGFTDQIPPSQPIQEFMTVLFAGCRHPNATSTSARGVITQEMLDGLKVRLVLRESAPQGAGSKGVRARRGSPRLGGDPAIVRVHDKLPLFTGGDACFVGVTSRTGTLHDQTAAQVNTELTRHRDKGFNLVRLHIYTSRIKAAPSGDEFIGSELAKLVDILQHCNGIGMYLDMTLFATNRRGENPAWYEALSEEERWRIGNTGTPDLRPVRPASCGGLVLPGKRVAGSLQPAAVWGAGS